MPTPWSEVPFAWKVFTVVVAILTLAGLEFGLWYHWPQSSWLNKTASIVINLIIIAIVIYVAE